MDDAVSDRRYENAVIRLSDIATSEDKIEGFTFIGCHIEGPAVITISGDITMVECEWIGTADAVCWEIAPSRTLVIGTIRITDCHFERSSFRKVGVAGSAERLEPFRAMFLK